MKSEKLRVKRKVPNLNSLEAAICNVALFKTMKEKDFKDTIFISYSQEGVILEAQNEGDWNKANEFISNFIKSKKIEILAFGYQREAYDNLINGDLKQYTKRLKQKGYDDPYPYINLIHYQRLRKSCEFMSKSRYYEPLAQWEKKNKQTPNFAYLVVEPRERFEEVKRNLLGMLKGSQTQIVHFEMKIQRFLQFYYCSEYSSALQSLYQKKELEIRTEEDIVYITVYGDIEVVEKQVAVKTFSKGLHRLKYQIMKQDQIQRTITLAKEIIKSSTLQQMNTRLTLKYSDNYCFITYQPSEHKQLQTQLAEIYDKPINKQNILSQILRFKICQFSQITFVDLPQINEPSESRQQQVECEPNVFQKTKSEKEHPLMVGLINGCQFLLQHFRIQSVQQLSNFLIYLEEYQRSSNSWIVRFYGICQNNNEYYTILDYKTHSLYSMHSNGEIVDEIQVCSIILQILHTIHFLHTLPSPRCIGVVKVREVFVPGGVILPYLYDLDNYTMQDDIKMVGTVLNKLLSDPNEELSAFIQKLVSENPYERMDMESCIARLEGIMY